MLARIAVIVPAVSLLINWWADKKLLSDWFETSTVAVHDNQKAEIENSEPTTKAIIRRTEEIESSLEMICSEIRQWEEKTAEEMPNLSTDDITRELVEAQSSAVTVIERISEEAPQILRDEAIESLPESSDSTIEAQSNHAKNIQDFKMLLGRFSEEIGMLTDSFRMRKEDLERIETSRSALQNRIKDIADLLDSTRGDISDLNAQAKSIDALLSEIDPARKRVHMPKRLQLHGLNFGGPLFLGGLALACSFIT